jgi:hypothetical protein
LNAGSSSIRDFLGEEEKRTQGELDKEKVTVRPGSGKCSFTQTKVANDGSRSAREAKELYLSEKQAAEDTIQRQDVPAGYKRYLERYFDRIQPEAEEGSEEK